MKKQLLLLMLILGMLASCSPSDPANKPKYGTTRGVIFNQGKKVIVPVYLTSEEIDIYRYGDTVKIEKSTKYNAWILSNDQTWQDEDDINLAVLER